MAGWWQKVSAQEMVWLPLGIGVVGTVSLVLVWRFYPSSTQQREYAEKTTITTETIKAERENAQANVPVTREIENTQVGSDEEALTPTTAPTMTVMPTAYPSPPPPTVTITPVPTPVLITAKGTATGQGFQRHFSLRFPALGGAVEVLSIEGCQIEDQMGVFNASSGQIERGAGRGRCSSDSGQKSGGARYSGVINVVARNGQGAVTVFDTESEYQGTWTIGW